MQSSFLVLNIPTLQLFAYYESWNILAGNSKEPKVYTFFIWFIFPAAAWHLNKTNDSLSKGTCNALQLEKSKQPSFFLCFCFHWIKGEHNKYSFIFTAEGLIGQCGNVFCTNVTTGKEYVFTQLHKQHWNQKVKYSFNDLNIPWKKKN